MSTKHDDDDDTSAAASSNCLPCLRASIEPSKGSPAAVEPSPPPQPPLPSDLLLEIVARSDAATAVRCTATSKPLRRAILDPAFRRLLAANGGGGFDPALLLGVSYKLLGGGEVVVNPQSQHLRLDGILNNLPEISRDGLLLLRLDVHEPKIIDRRVYLTSPLVLWVCDVFTGHVAASLPQAALKYSIPHFARARDYATALLITADDGTAAGRSFEVIAMDMHMQNPDLLVQDRRLGRRPCRVHPAPDHPWIFVSERDTPFAAAVIGRTVHWLCFRQREPGVCGDMIVPALHADTAAATEVELPQGLLGRIGDVDGRDPYYAKHRGVMLHATADGRLGVVAAEVDAITVWTLSGEDARWSRRVVVDREAIAGQLTGGWDVLDGTIKLEGLGQRSGTLLFSTKRYFGGLAQLNLVTKEAVELSSGGYPTKLILRPCVHDIDLGSLLRSDA